jgi:excisionase family DNA binding protein
LATKDVADRLDVTQKTVCRWIRSGKIDAQRPGNEYRIPRSELDELLGQDEGSAESTAQGTGYQEQSSDGQTEETDDEQPQKEGPEGLKNAPVHEPFSEEGDAREAMMAAQQASNEGESLPDDHLPEDGESPLDLPHWIGPDRRVYIPHPDPDRENLSLARYLLEIDEEPVQPHGVFEGEDETKGNGEPETVSIRFW